ncbi:stalk domain-containing protein [Pelotomaculum propionicicum]|uniref:stalk domain-containing protein n=1 Tax=Pelotomaculum propionicicum TaxID=258475 RepID=UPI003B789910
MKCKRYLTVLLAFLMCFGIVFSANAASDLTAKQLILKQLNNLKEYYPPGDINKNASGTAEIKVKTFKGLAAYLAGFARPLDNLAGSNLKIDYKVNSDDNKIQGNYILDLNSGRHNGELYFNNDTLIMSSDIISVMRDFDPDLFKGKNIPEYLYLKDESISGIRFNSDTSILLSPEFKELCIFFLEAVPDKYFSVSLTDQKIYFRLDQAGFEDVALSVLQKIKDEKVRFDTLTTNYLKVAAGPGQDTDKMMKDIFGDIDNSIKDGSYPDTKEKLKILMGNFRLKEYIVETSLLPGGQNVMSAKAYFGSVPEDATYERSYPETGFMNIGSEPYIKGQINFKSESTSSKDRMHGTYSFDVNVKEYETRINADFQITGEYNQTAKDKDSNLTFSIDTNDFNNNFNFIDLVIEGKSRVVNDENVQVGIPVLTGANSKDIKKLMANTPDILLNGVPVACDVDPYIIKTSNSGYKIMVPLRNLAEAMGCQVTWVEPDRISIVRGDTTITMFNKKKEYTVNGVGKQLDVPLFITGKRTMAPLSVLTSEFGCTYDYDPASNTVNIYSK